MQLKGLRTVHKNLEQRLDDTRSAAADLLEDFVVIKEDRENRASVDSFADTILWDSRSVEEFLKEVGTVEGD